MTDSSSKIMHPRFWVMRQISESGLIQQSGLADDFWLKFSGWQRFALSECSCCYCYHACYGLHFIILASCKPGQKPRRRLVWACRKHVESRLQATNMLQTWWFLQPCVWHDLETRPVFCNMEDTDAIVLACSTAIVVCSVVMMLATKKKWKHSTWVKQYIRDRHRYDASSTVLPEVKANDMSRYVQ